VHNKLPKIENNFQCVCIKNRCIIYGHQTISSCSLRWEIPLHIDHFTKHKNPFGQTTQKKMSNGKAEGCRPLNGNPIRR